MWHRLGILIGASVLLWGSLLYPGYLLFGEAALLHSAVALGLCLIPAATTLAWACMKQKSPDQVLLQALGGTGIRLGFVLGIGLLLYTRFPDYFTDSFWGWLFVFYLFTLTLEMVLIMRGRTQSQKIS